MRSADDLPDRVIGMDKLLELTGFENRATIIRLVAQGRFPQPFKIGERKCGWRLSTVLAHLADLEAKAQVRAPKRRVEHEDVVAA